MGPIWHIAIRELKGRFQSSLGWLVLGSVSLITGVFWHRAVGQYVQAQNDLVYNPTVEAILSSTDHLLAPYFDFCNIIFVMMMPAISMGLFASEYRNRTWELLATSPISTWQIVLGKFFGALGFVSCMVLILLHGPVMLYWWSSPEPAAIAGGGLSLLAISACLLAFGMLMSSFTKSQLVALALSFSLSLTMIVVGLSGGNPDSLVMKMNLITHVQDMWGGLLRASDVVYFLGFTMVCLFATHQRLESNRWQ